MRRLAVGAALSGVAVLGARLVMPRLHERLLAACTRMFEQLPEDFPPRRMLAGIEETRRNTARALLLLEAQAGKNEQARAGTPTGRAPTGAVGTENEPLASIGAGTSEHVAADAWKGAS